MPASVPGAAARTALAGTLFALLAAIGFSAKAILVKLAYAQPVDAATLISLRLLFSFASPAPIMRQWWDQSGRWTIFFGYWFLSEPVMIIQITGAALVLAGVTLVSARRT